MFDLSTMEGLNKGEINQFAFHRWQNEVQGRRRLGERILPWVETEDYEVSTGQVSFRSVAAGIIAMDSPLPRTPGATLAKQEYGLLKLGRKSEIKESELKALRDILGRRRLTPQQWATTAPFMLANRLTMGFLDRAEWMRWQALSLASIPLRAGVSVDYPVPMNHRDTLTTTARWDQASTADGLADIIEWSTEVRNTTGRHFERVFMSSEALEHLTAQEITQRKIAAALGTTGQQIAAGMNNLFDYVPQQEALDRYLRQRGLGTGPGNRIIIVYDGDFHEMDDIGNTQPVATRFLPVNRVVGVVARPEDGGLSAGVPGATASGYTALGPTVENGFNPGHYVWIETQMEPYMTAVKGVGWALPVLSDPNTVFQAQVFDS